jgi:hypothetical protein
MLAFASLAAVNLGEGDEAVKKWGPKALNRKETSAEDEGMRKIHSLQEFDGVRIEKNEYIGSGEWEGQYAADGNFTFSRTGAGIGGLFIGAPWCDSSYVEKIIGDPNKKERDESGGTTLLYGDEWSLIFTFDASGVLSKVEHYWFSGD